MSTILALIGIGLLLGLVLLAVVLVRTSRPTINWQAPTPREAEIKRDGDDLAKRIEDQAEQDRKEVANAKVGKLADLVRRRMFRR